MYRVAVDFAMNQDEERKDLLVSKLILDIKALSLLHPSDPDLRSVVTEKVLSSPDDQVKRFVSSLRAHKPQESGSGVIIVIGELLLASFLMVAGVVMIAPLLVGGSTSDSLLQYFSNSIGHVATSPAFLPILPVLVVLLAVLLLMSALYALRRASLTLREEGLMNR